MQTGQREQAERGDERATQAEIAVRLTDLARRIRDLLTEWPSDAVWNRPGHLFQLADDCKAEAEDFDEAVPGRGEALAAWDDVLGILKQGRMP